MDLEKLQYLPLALPHFSLLALIFLVLVVWIEVQALRSAYLGMGFGPHAALILFAGRQLFEYPGGTSPRGADRLGAGGLVLRQCIM